MPSWLLARTEPNREKFAESALSAWLHCDVYLPQMLVERIYRRKFEQVLRPYFPCYIFICDDGRGVRHINTAPGISKVVGSSDGPSRVRQEVIDGLRAQEQNGVIQAWMPGQSVRVNGLDAVFQQRDGRQRARVLIQMFASQYEVMTSVERIEAPL